MTRAPAKGKTVQLAHLRIGYKDFVLPSDKAIEVVKLMQHAIECDTGYEEGHTYTLKDAPDVSFTLVRASQIRAPRAEPESKQATILGLPAPVRRLSR